MAFTELGEDETSLTHPSPGEPDRQAKATAKTEGFWQLKVSKFALQNTEQGA